MADQAPIIEPSIFHRASMARVWRVVVGGHDPEADVILHPEPESWDKQKHKAIKIITAVITEHQDEKVTWHRYNDSRFNGCIPLEQLREEWPNLKKLAEAQLHGKTLASIFQDELEIDPETDQVFLEIFAGDPLAILKGAIPWISSIQTICLRGHQSIHLSTELPEHWLEGQGFRHSTETSYTWTQDKHLRDAILERDILRDQVQVLEGRMEAINQELDEILMLIDQSLTPERTEGHQH